MYEVNSKVDLSSEIPIKFRTDSSETLFSNAIFLGSLPLPYIIPGTRPLLKRVLFDPIFFNLNIIYKLLNADVS